MKKESLKFYFQIRTKIRISPQYIHKELKSAIRTQAPCLRTIQRWYKHFESGNKSLEDQDRSGRPITEFTDVNINRVRQVIEDNPYSTYDEIKAETSLTTGIVHKIIHQALKLKNITSRWVPHRLSEKNRQDRSVAKKI